MAQYAKNTEEKRRRDSAEGMTCGDCKYFVKDFDRAFGICQRRKYCRNHWGLENPDRPFRPYQSRMACKEFFEKKAE